MERLNRIVEIRFVLAVRRLAIGPTSRNKKLRKKKSHPAIDDLRDDEPLKSPVEI